MTIPLLAIALYLLVPCAIGAQSGPCLGPDSASADLVRDIAQYATATDSDWAATRDSLRLPSVPPGEVVLVTDSVICRKAAAAFAVHVLRFRSRLSGRVYVVRAGSTYSVVDPSWYIVNPGDWAIMTFDSHWKLLSSHH